jgi:hypothetical protein
VILLAIWVLSGTPFFFSYVHRYPTHVVVQQEPPVFALTVTNDTLRPCDHAEFYYTDVVLRDGAQIPSDGNPTRIGALGPFETRQLNLAIADTTGGQIIVVPNSGAARALNPGELAGATVEDASADCPYDFIKVD